MHLLCGLGNPGAGYAKNRHNAGFLAADAIASRHGFPAFTPKFGGRLSDGRIDGSRALILKPLTYMNRSGQAVGEALRFYKIPPENLIVLHDELDLPLGRVRVKKGGGAGGHNGIKSIDEHIGPEYWRVRIGIGHPGDKELVTPYVLSDFSAEEKPAIAKLLEIIAQHMPLLLAGDAAAFLDFS